ncbi:NUDIX domain-containing protein [Neobacillus sp. D3-1R]|uniref:NUDIX hydrolase n=1 Tax=Neobacillus sp. D3-1R TaxID=3445778 RepID=UPI003F9F2102
MKKTIYVDWGGNHIRLTWLPDFFPDISKVTSVHGPCFDKNKVLLVQINGRGFNFPGGHVDSGETPEEAFHREVYEEGYVKGIAHFLGSIEVSHEDNPDFDPNGKYPLIGYQLFYRLDITECFPFQRSDEANTRIWVEPSEVPYVLNDHELAYLVLNEALLLSPENSK